MRTYYVSNACTKRIKALASYGSLKCACIEIQQILAMKLGILKGTSRITLEQIQQKAQAEKTAKKGR